MSKTLLILSTHFIDENIISEYLKMRNTPNVDAILAIDNNAYKYDFKTRIENKIFYGSSVKCFFFDSKLHDEMELPYFNYSDETTFGGVMWHNCDYRFYYIKKFFPDYDYYWQFEYDVFCNAETYEGFLKKFETSRADLIIKNFRQEKLNGTWGWTHGMDWIYHNQELYGGLFPAVRLSARAVDFLYKRRLAHKNIYKLNDSESRWAHCELFTPTELMNNGFSCENLDEPNVHLQNFYLNDDRFFLKHDDKLYHPVKSAKNEIAKLKNQVEDLNLLSRKIFVTSLIKFLDVKGLPHHVSPDFNYMIMPIVTRGGGQPLLYYAAQIFGNSIYIGLHCEENFSKINLAEFAGVQNLQRFGATNDGRRLSIFAILPDAIFDAAHVAEIMKNLITVTYPILKKNLL